MPTLRVSSADVHEAAFGLHQCSRQDRQTRLLVLVTPRCFSRRYIKEEEEAQQKQSEILYIHYRSKPLNNKKGDSSSRGKGVVCFSFDSTLNNRAADFGTPLPYSRHRQTRPKKKKKKKKKAKKS